MAFRRVAASSLGQAALFGCGAGVLAAASARLYAAAAVMTLMAVWIAAAAAWQGRLRPHTSPERPPPSHQRDDAEERLLTTLLDQTPAPVLTRDAQGVLQARNRAARTLFRTDDRVANPPPALLDALEGGSGLERLTLPGADPKEAERAYALALGDVLSAAGPMRLAVLLDIEPELRAVEAAALRELLQVLSHEIMNGLTPVASLAETAAELMATPGPQARAQAADAVATLARRAQALARFAEDYRRLARLPAPIKRSVSLHDILEELEKLARSRWEPLGVSLTVTGPPTPVRAQLDADQIFQALTNLIANAAEAALVAGGTPTVVVAASAVAGRSFIQVQDSGQGVPDIDQERIFQPFFTTKPNGSGVGLSLARQIARAHGGDLLLVDPSETPGATFQLWFTA